MGFFDWQDDFSVNIKEIDNQHRVLVSLLNELYEAMKSGGGREALGRILSELVSYTKSHFATEERLMRAHGYPDYLAHKDKHEKMTEMVKKYIQKYESNEMNSLVEISSFLKDWLKKHILETDMGYRLHLNGKGVY